MDKEKYTTIRILKEDKEKLEKISMRDEANAEVIHRILCYILKFK